MSYRRFPAARKPSQKRREFRSEKRTDGKRAEYRTEVRTENRTLLPVKRQTKRYSFEFYVDQLTRLKRLKIGGGRGRYISLSDIVRQAVDNYSKTRANKP